MKIVSKIEKDSTVLGSIIKFSSGLIALHGQSSIISKTKKDDRWLKGIISGSEIKDYTVNSQGNFVQYDKSKIKSGYDCVDYFEDKLFLRQTGDKLICAFDGDRLLALNNIHIGNLINASYSLKFIAALLNSSLMNFYYKKISLESGRTMAQTDIETVECLPVRSLTPDRQRPLIDFVDGILNLTKEKGYKEDPVRQNEIDSFQKRIDQLVYELYDLTPEEIKIIEGSVK
jgi:hypothetical protein